MIKTKRRLSNLQPPPLTCKRCGRGYMVPDGYDSIEYSCLACGWRWYAQPGEQKPSTMKRLPEPTRICTRCGTEKPRSAFYSKIGGRDGLMASCIECWLAYKRVKREKAMV